jgi:hypothetical protein
LRWQRPQTKANGRKPRKESEDAKLLVSHHLSEECPSSLGFRGSGNKNPSLSAS